MFVRHPSMHHLKTGVGVQFSRGPNHAVSQDEKSPQQESAWGLGLRHSRLRPRYCGEPVGGAADRAAPASRLSLQASQTPGPAERALGTQGGLLFRQPHPASSHSTSTWGEEQGRVGALLGGAGVLEHSGALPQSENPALATPGGSQAGVQSALERACAVSPPRPRSLHGQVQRNRTESHPIQNPNPNFEPHSRQADSGPASSRSPGNRHSNPRSGHLVGSTERGFLGIDFCDSRQQLIPKC